MNTEINNLKSSVSNGKATVASAITDKGVSTSATDTFSKMAENIRSIASGSNVETGTVVNEYDTQILTVRGLRQKNNFVLMLYSIYNNTDSHRTVINGNNCFIGAYRFNGGVVKIIVAEASSVGMRRCYYVEGWIVESTGVISCDAFGYWAFSNYSNDPTFLYITW